MWRPQGARERRIDVVTFTRTSWRYRHSEAMSFDDPEARFYETTGFLIPFPEGRRARGAVSENLQPHEGERSSPVALQRL